MNPLEAIKDKLKIKPKVQEFKPVAIMIKPEEKLIEPKIKKNVQFKMTPIYAKIPESQNISEKEEEKKEKDEEEDKYEKELIEGVEELGIEDKPKKEAETKSILKTNIIDKRTNGYDRQSLIQKLNENKLSKVTIKPTILRQEQMEPIQYTKQIDTTKKAKKITEVPKLIIEEEEEGEELEIPKETEKKELTKMKDEFEIKPKTKTEKSKTKKLLIIAEEPESEKDEQKDESIDYEEIKIEVPLKKERKTKKIEKGVAILGPETVVSFGDTSLEKRVPKKNIPVNIRVPSYYMNNREIFVNFINSIFEPYKKELEENSENISCDNIGQVSSNLSLLTHQKIVRDYINLYTPYRGLLLYHGLGSGKTCSSIAIAEGMKDAKRIIVMTPASLRRNYMEELKKCGDLIYKKNQYWEWISLEQNPEALKVLSAVLNLPQEYIKRKGGAWFINIKKKSNYSELNSADKKELDEQIDKMIQSKYTFINYNGLRLKRLEELTNGFTTNLFDDAVVIIDEAHNLVSRIVNKYKKEKPIVETDRGDKESLPKSLATKIYEYLLTAKNSRIILLTGTPVINYMSEFGILFNILRGYIKTWEIQLNVKTTKKIDKDSLREMLLGEKTLDYLDYSPSSKILTITRNPFGFKNKIKKESGYQGVSNAYKNEKGEQVFETEYISDEDFERKIINILKRNEIEIIPNSVKIRNRKALPDKLDEFSARYVDPTTIKIKNADALKRRIIGLTSYFRSAQESLLPKFDKMLGVDYHVIRVPMSDMQFKIYEAARIEERKQESKQKLKKNMEDDKATSSTYRIFSRLFCNFAIPNRPLPKNMKLMEGMTTEENLEENPEEVEEIEEKKTKTIKESKKTQKETKNTKKNKTEVEEENIDESKEDTLFGNLFNQLEKTEKNIDLMDEEEGEVEGDELLKRLGGTDYERKMSEFTSFIENNSEDYLTSQALQTYSPKFLHILENIQDSDHIGLHLLYSQFRTLEGIGLFTLVLKKNGFAQFKIKKNIANDSWDLDMDEEDYGKPTFGLYTGTETAEEKEIIRNIYNGDWQYIPTNISNKLKQIANNNNMGEIMKVLMITSSGSEGINLKNTRYVHIMEPYWHPVRMEQVIGRARRICSHKDLPKNLQTVEVFVYLMVFTEAQLKSNDAIELKRKDLSKIPPKMPFTSDQYLYEISEIKSNFISQLTDIIKETSFDCYLYSNGKCVNFGEPTNNKFSYVPDYAEQQNDSTLQANKVKIEWVGKPITISGKKYVYRRISSKILYIYDYTSYEQALQNPGIMPVQIGSLEVNEKGEQVFKKI